MDNKRIVKYDFFVSITIFVLALAVAIQKLFFNDASLALINFAISLIPAIYIIISRRVRKPKLVLIPILIIFVRMITSLISFEKLGNYDIIVQLCYDISFAISLFSIYSIIDSMKTNKSFSFKYITRAIIIISLIFSIYNLIDNSEYYLYFTDIKYRYLINFSSFFTNRNMFGALLLFGLISTDYEIANNGKKVFRIIKIFLLINLILTLSRNSILAYVIFYSVNCILNKKYKRIIIPLIIIIIILSFDIFGLRTIAITYLVRGDELSSGRMDIWKICLNHWFSSPIIGYGELYISNIINTATGVTSMHSWFFKLLLNGGILNVILFSYLIVNSFKKAFYLVRNNEKNGKLVLASLCGIVFYGIFEEINLFEFGLINIIFTTFFITIPIVLFNKENGDCCE